MYEATPFTSIPNSEAKLNELEARLRHQSGDTLRLSLLEALADTYPVLRHEAALRLARRVDNELIEAVTAILSKESSHIPDGNQYSTAVERAADEGRRQELCMVLREAEGPAVTELMIELTESDDSDVRFQALKNLHAQNLSSEQLTPIVERCLEDNDPDVNLVAAQIAGEFGLESFRPTIDQLFENTSGKRRFQHGLILTELSSEPLEEEKQEELLDCFLDALKNEETTSAAVEGLVELANNGADVGDSLRGVMNSWFKHPILKVKAASALALLGDEDGFQHLDDALTGGRKDAKGYALELAGEHQFDRFLDRVAEIARSNSYHSETALIALQNWGTPEAEKLRSNLETPESE